MASSQFLVRNRHSNVWYGRIVIPQQLRDCFNGKREFRKSLGTSNRTQAKRQALGLWVECQKGFDRLKYPRSENTRFKSTSDFLTWLSDEWMQTDMSKKKPPGTAYGSDITPGLITTDILGGEHTIEFDNPEKEANFALKLHENAIALLEKYKDRPEILDRITKTLPPLLPGQTPASQVNSLPETPTLFSEAIDLYIDKLKTQGRKGKKLAQRTLHNYEGRLEFWKAYFGDKLVHEITFKEISAIQSWMTNLMLYYSNAGFTTLAAIEQAKTSPNNKNVISDKTRAEYLGQLKGLLEYAHACGFILSDLSSHVEIPNTKQTRTVDRLPFTNDDLQKIFPENYGIDFGTKTTRGFDRDAKFWIPLLAVFSGARLEELCQLKTSDIKTDKKTNIIYADISESGFAGDGQKKHTKNKNSVRPIPIHSTLIHIGFMDYASQRKKDASDNALFKLKRDKQGRLGKGVSNWFSRLEQRKTRNNVLGYIERRGVVSKGINDGQKWSKTFHSFRHAVIDNLRDNKTLASGEHILETHIGIVVGHTKEKSETAQYGKNRSQLELRKDLIEAIDFKDVDFKKIRWL